ncbi:hypothetical protein, partial [Escherichia coli]|uniref:hypothetical protein n=1 Tax=Escherichia coli TaxID=562 RepID=UPI003F51B489
MGPSGMAVAPVREGGPSNGDDEQATSAAAVSASAAARDARRAVTSARYSPPLSTLSVLGRQYRPGSRYRRFHT